MTPVSSHFLQTSDRTLLRYGQRLVPEHCREEWLRYWYAELCHLRSRNPTWGRHSLALGLLLDAAWLRQESWRRNLSGSATLCLVFLILLLPLAALPVFVLAGNLNAFGITLVFLVPSLISGALPSCLLASSLRAARWKCALFRFTAGSRVAVSMPPRLHCSFQSRSFSVPTSPLPCIPLIRSRASCCRVSYLRCSRSVASAGPLSTAISVASIAFARSPYLCAWVAPPTTSWSGMESNCPVRKAMECSASRKSKRVRIVRAVGLPEATHEFGK